ncbi:MAG TPA: tannase/feruloyl esterase family alpha/beta hydrolase [Candidatus Acidoferrum sp.]|nr:tannase/feruloyl esterase family alpha/beta hydrolase [Candidatus Acidoferrum sp.]
MTTIKTTPREISLFSLRRPGWLLAGALALLAGCGQQAQQAAPPAPVATAAELCQKLAGMTIAATAIGEPTSGAVVSSAELVAADAEKNSNGEYCKVLGDIKPVDATAPDIKFEVNLPTHWNRKTLQLGGGGLNGQLVNGLGRYAKQPDSEDTPLKRGYVTLGSDSGHQSKGGFDGKFYLNEEALENYGHMQLKKTHDVALALVQARYGNKPEHSYFIGGSQGGHEGFDVVQRYPDDYDGVVAGYPAHNVVMLHLSAWNYAKALLGKGAWINPNKAAALVAKVYERCDKLDGAADGIISNLAACETENAVLRKLTKDNPIRCKDGKDTDDTCLSDAQLKALIAVDTPFKVGFPIFADDTDSAVFPKWTPFAGSTFLDGGLKILGAEKPEQALQYAPGAATLGLAIARDENLNVYDKFDPKMYEARIKELGIKMSANSTDLDKYKQHGGKLIFFHGLVDDFISPYSSMQYYSRLQTKYADALPEFVRFYTIPGMGHVTGVFNARVASLDALEAWVEKGQAPGDLVATDANKDTAGRSRPMCQYPAWPHYDGKGDINMAASFSCQP